MKKRYIAIAILFLLFAVNCMGPAGSKGNAAKKSSKQVSREETGKDTANDRPAETEAVPVQVVKPARGNISSFLLFSSNVDSEKMVDIYPMIPGIVETIEADEGDWMEKGGTLAVLDDREAALNEAKSRINYEQLKMEFDRQLEIYKQELISKEEYERLKFRTESALIEWKQQKLLLSYTRITTPISGMVNRRYIKVGNKVTAAQLAFSVVNTREKIAVVNIPAQERSNLFVKQDALIILGAREIGAAVKRISPAIDPQSGTFKVTVEVADRDNVLAVGEFVNVKIIKKVHENVVLLTKEALLYEGGKVFVFIVDGGNKAFKKEIQTGFEDGSRVEVTGGISEQDRVVTAGKSSLKSNTLVKVVEPIVS